MVILWYIYILFYAMTLFYSVVDLRFGNAALQWQLTRIALEADYGRRNAALACL